MAFTYAYFVGRYKDRFSEEDFEYRTPLDSFRTVFGSFVGGPETPKDLLDFLFGTLSVIILLNVVIAIVSDAWEDSGKEVVRVFWTYRLEYIYDVDTSLFTQRFSNFRSRMKAKYYTTTKKADESEMATIATSENFWRRFYHPRFQNKYPSDLPPILQIAYSICWGIFFLFGLVSFGLLWPMRLKTDIFGRNKGLEPSQNADKEDFSMKEQRRRDQIATEYLQDIKRLETQMESKISDLDNKISDLGNKMDLVVQMLSQKQE